VRKCASRDGVAVGRSLCDTRHADRAAGPADVSYNHTLTERCVPFASPIRRATVSVARRPTAGTHSGDRFGRIGGLGRRRLWRIAANAMTPAESASLIEPWALPQLLLCRAPFLDATCAV